MNNSEVILNNEDVVKMLDSLLREPAPFWNEFYTDREKKIPFFLNLPDENLVNYFEKGLLKPGKVLELGSGPGRNALYLARQGCEVDAVDLSQEAIQWGKERALENKLNVHFINNDIFNMEVKEGSYDLVYDSGCFHHIAPHRRMSYIDLLHKAIKPNGFFSLICFVAGGRLGGSEISDWEVYRLRSLNGGLGYTEERLKTIFKDFQLVEMRKMEVLDEESSLFGYPDLWTVLFKKVSL
ncbi:methyltransferase type 11 [Fictibacillus macauensis ZFHKF-1]|uniref:Methyltransferase type 11 n=1 Tax=Fictibacillus macauensis ZFHKF-1 TaxID=1196324 RepID=I8ALD5_9BACL|nr:class I SAM-dependent methyltransferase [Fictibacillus macauensis]EIT86707.1 methyltransferase type 11 [Fictibacillus macauensis ZFHKF-1]